MAGFNLEDYPRPIVAQTEEERVRDADALVQLRSDDFASRMRALGFDYTVDTIKDTPAAAAAETGGYGDAHYLGYMDDTARAVISPSYATGSDLDLCVARSGTVRLADESDESLRERDRLNRKGKSAAGPDDYYKAAARSVNARVRDVAIDRTTRDFSTRVLLLSVLTSDNGGVPDQELLDSISAVVNDTAFRSRNVVVEVSPAVLETVNVDATLWLYPDAIEPADPEQTLRTAFDVEQRLDFDLTSSFIMAKLMFAGVQRVELSGWTDHFASYNRALALGDVSIAIKRV